MDIFLELEIHKSAAKSLFVTAWLLKIPWWLRLFASIFTPSALHCSQQLNHSPKKAFHLWSFFVAFYPDCTYIYLTWCGFLVWPLSSNLILTKPDNNCSAFRYFFCIKRKFPCVTLAIIPFLAKPNTLFKNEDFS